MAAAIGGGRAPISSIGRGHAIRSSRSIRRRRRSADRCTSAMCFSYTHTDVIARFQRMRGHGVFYSMGWDDNGLPTERRVQNYYGVRCELTAAQGYMALTYQWRGCKANSVDQALIQKFLEDTRAAITFVREQGAEKIILVGASLGGCASAKLAVESQASGTGCCLRPHLQFHNGVSKLNRLTSIRIFQNCLSPPKMTIPSLPLRRAHYTIWLLNPRNGRLIRVLRMAPICLKGRAQQNCNSAFWNLF